MKLKNIPEDKNMTLPAKESLFLTQSLYESAWLLSRGFPLLGVRNSSSTFKEIIFPDSPKLRQAISEYYNDHAICSFVTSLKKIKSEIFKDHSKA